MCVHSYKYCYGLKRLVSQAKEQKIDLVSLMMLVAKRGMHTLWIECGGQLAGALLQAGLVDELVVYLAPKLLGDNARGLCHLIGIHHLSDALTLRFNEVVQIGTDLRLRLQLL